jgi:hypothetical protein
VIVKCILFLEEALQGWTETYFINSLTFDEAGISTAAFGTPLGPSVIATRIKLLPASISVLGMRASDPANPRASFFFASGTLFPTPSANRPVGQNFISQQGLYGLGRGIISGFASWTQVTAEEVDTAVKVRMETADGKHRRILLLRGVPNKIAGNDGVYLKNDPTWFPSMQSFLAALTQGLQGDHIKAIDTTQPAPIQVGPVQLYPTNYEYITLQTTTQVMKAGPVPVLVGDNVVIRGYRGGYRLNGPWRIVGIGGSGPYLYTLGPKRRNVAINYQGQAGVTIQALGYAYQTVVNAFDEGLYVVSRKTGRPFGLLAGRRNVR